MLYMEKLKKCPSSPNCVCSISLKEDKSYIEPFKVNHSKEASKQKIIDICKNKLDAKLVEESENYLHFVFTTKIMRFKDDVEFLFSEDKIDVRSASRVGHSDLGTNRKRVEKIRELYGF